MDTKNLWAPWRSTYVGGEPEPGCVFCRARDEHADPARLVVKMGKEAMLVMNRFPYSTGHVMAMPTRHVGAMDEITPTEAAELWRLAVEAREALKNLYNPDGFNVGINLGRAAGAGITDHLHVHVVARWVGDTNFMPVFADVRVMPHHLEEVAEALKRELAKSS